MAVPPRFTAGDVKQAGLLVLLFPLAALSPERWWSAPCGLLARLTARRSFAHSRRLRAFLPGTLPSLADCSPDEYLVREEARFLEEYVQILREWTWKWRPQLQVEGIEQLEEALSRGKGVILWVSGFNSSDLVVKMALKRAGFPLVHLSRPTHGFSGSQFGVHVLNPIRKRVEDRYLKSRVVIESGSAVAALRALQRELRRNAVVSITVSDATAEPNEVVLPGGKLRVSGGPVELAALTGSALFPVFSRRTRSGFLVRIGAAVAGSEWSDGVEEALIRFGAQLEAAIREAPDQWTGWRTGSFSASEPPGA